MKARYWSLAIVLILINYLIFATLFTMLMEADFSATHATRTPVPTFTPAPAQPIIIVPTPAAPMSEPTPTATHVIENSESNSDQDASSHADIIQAKSVQPNPQETDKPQLAALGSVNIRSGPGPDYEVIGTLNSNTVMDIIGRDNQASWWQIEITGDTTGWVSNAVVKTRNSDDVPVVESAPLLEDTDPTISTIASPPSTIPEKPKYPFEPADWSSDESNSGLTRFFGEITDAGGNPVDGVFVQAQCGDYTVISGPSGSANGESNSESVNWPAGFYDLTIDTKPVPCVWVLTVVEVGDQQNVKAALSDSIPVQITSENSVVRADWRKTWD